MEISSSSRSLNILCLGVSHVNLEATIAIRKSASSTLLSDVKIDSTQSKRWDTAIHAVELGILTAMDGRDMARCIATEDSTHSTIYTVSQESAAQYRKDRHLHANFSRSNFCAKISSAFPSIRFDQVVLDYFWIPSGWSASHWTQTFFNSSLPGLVRYDLLNTDSVDCRIYLPFCLHSFRMILAYKETLLQYYDISFLRKNKLDAVSLWKGTQAIDAKQLQGILGKRRDQEEIYCKVTLREIMEHEETGIVSSQCMLSVARRIPHLEEVRFIALHPFSNLSGALPTTRSLCQKGPPLGRILGLNDAVKCSIPIVVSAKKSLFGKSLISNVTDSNKVKYVTLSTRKRSRDSSLGKNTAQTFVKQQSNQYRSRPLSLSVSPKSVAFFSTEQSCQGPLTRAKRKLY